jgi:SAM-dependent methyltransferase
MLKIVKLLKNYYFIFKANLVGGKNRVKELSYDEYISLQLEKTLDSERINKWKNDEWEIKLSGFIKMFSRHIEIINRSKSSLCLGARTGQEVAALRSLGIDSIGVDLVEFPPYTIVGDIHNLPFEDKVFDLAFTNIYDHILYPDKFAIECSRVLKKAGYLILHISLGFDPDEFSVNFIYDEKQIIKLFQEAGFNVFKSGVISNDYDSMNYELIFVNGN